MSTRHRIAGGLLGLLLVGTATAPAALGAGPTVVPPAATGSASAPVTGSSTTRTAAPSGSGSACTAAAPCAVDTALRASRPGEVVELRDGDYPTLRAVSTRSAATAERPVVVRPVTGAEVTLDGLTVSAPGLVFRDLRSTGVVYVNPSATGLTLERVHVDGSGIFLRAAAGSTGSR